MLSPLLKLPSMWRCFIADTPGISPPPHFLCEWADSVLGTRSTAAAIHLLGSQAPAGVQASLGSSELLPLIREPQLPLIMIGREARASLLKTGSSYLLSLWSNRRNPRAQRFFKISYQSKDNALDCHLFAYFSTSSALSWARIFHRGF